MIIKLIELAVFLLVIYGGLMLFDGIYKVPPRSTLKGVNNAKLQETFTDKFKKSVVQPLVNLITPFIKLSEETNHKLEVKFKSVNIDFTPSQYYANAIVMALFSLGLPLACMLVGFSAAILPSCALVIVTFYHYANMHKSLIAKKKKEIEAGLPSFIRSILYKLNDSNAENSVVKADLISIFEDYYKVSDPVFSYDVSVLIMQMKSMEIEKALRNFSGRLAIPEVGFLCNALVGLTRGERQTEALSALAREMDIKSKENIKRELEARPGKITRACIPLFVIAFIAMGYVLLSAMTGGMATFK